jgi:SAM-dependent methyltransferase
MLGGLLLTGCRQLAPFVPTPTPVVERMLELAHVTKDDVVYDLGSGDGRIVIAAAGKYGATAVGFEIDPELVQVARENAKLARVDHLVEIRQQDLLTADFSNATVVTIYLGPSSNFRLRPVLRRQLRPGARIVSHEYDMGGWEPDRTEEVTDAGNTYTIHLWRIGE